MVVVDAKATYRSEGAWSYDRAAKRCTVTARPADPEWQQTAWELSTVTVPDRRFAYRLAVGSSGTVAQTFKIGVSDVGLLTSMNYSATDQRAEIATGVLKIVAGVAGAAVGINQLGAPVGALKRSMSVQRRGATPPKEPALPLTTDEACYLALFPVMGVVQEQLDDREQYAGELERARADRSVLLARVAGTISAADLKKLEAQDVLQQRRIAFAESRLDAIRAAILAGITRTKTVLKITPVDTTFRVQVALDLTELESKLPTGTVDALSASNTAQKALVDVARIAVVLADVNAGTGSAPTLDTKTSTIGCKVTTAEKCTSVYFRHPIPRLVTVVAATGPKRSDTLQPREARMVSLISSDDPTLSVAFEPSRLGQATMALAFGRHGTVTGLEETRTAGAATASSLLATALSDARTEFVSGVQAVGTAQASLLSIQSATRAARIKELQDRKSLLEAQLAIDGSSATRDQVAQKQALEAELALLNAQQSLSTAQAGNATAADVATLRAQLDRVKIELELLQKQMELEKARRDSDAAKSDKTVID